MQHHRRRHPQLLERVRRRLEMPSREVQVHRRVREIGMTEQQLNRPQVGTRFEQVRRIGVPQGVWRQRLSMPALRVARRTASQITFEVIGASARQP